MRFRLAETEAVVGYEVIAALAAVLILDRENAVICCIAAAILHEAGHLWMMRRFHVRVREIRLRLFDVLIRADAPSDFCAEACVTLGGPAVNFACAALSMPFSRKFFFANLFLGIFNSLPAESLDGGRLLYLFLSRRLTPHTCTAVLKTLTVILLIPIMTAGVLLLFRSRYNYSLLAVALYLLTVLFLK